MVFVHFFLFGFPCIFKFLTVNFSLSLFFLACYFIYVKVTLLAIYEFRIVCPPLKMFIAFTYLFGVWLSTPVVGGTRATAHVWRSKDNFESWFSPSATLVQGSGHRAADTFAHWPISLAWCLLLKQVFRQSAVSPLATAGDAVLVKTYVVYQCLDGVGISCLPPSSQLKWSASCFGHGGFKQHNSRIFL